MNLYDEDIRKLEQLLRAYPMQVAQLEKPWKQTKTEQLILRSDMAYELGGGTLPAVSGLAFTMDEELVKCNQVCVIGPELQQIQEDVAYARFTWIRLKEKTPKPDAEQEWYRAMRRIDYTRYRVYPEGFMLRISSVKEREPVRVSQKAIADGISFARVGACFNEAYRAHKEVAAVKTIFITDPQVEAKQLQTYASRFEQITESLNHIFSGLQMDCSHCGLQSVCEEIEGLRELHFAQQSVGHGKRTEKTQ